MNHTVNNTAVLVRLYGTIPTVFQPGERVIAYRRFMAHGVAFTCGLDLREHSGGKYSILSERYAAWERSQPCVVDAANIQPGDYLLCPQVRPSGAFTKAEWCRPKREVRNPPKPVNGASDSAAWLFGLYIADGNAVQDHKVVVTLGSDQTETIAKLVSCWQDLGFKAAVYEHETYVRVTVYSSVAANTFRNWFGVSSATKRIPSFLLNGWDLRPLIDGVVAGDGCDHRDGKVVSTTSITLAHQLHRLLIEQGERPSFQPQPRNGGEFSNAAPGWTVSWYPGGGKMLRTWRGFYMMRVREVATHFTEPVASVDSAESERWLRNNVLLA